MAVSSNRLLTVLQDHLLAEDGTTKRTADKLKDAQASFKRSRLNYLRLECLVRLLRVHGRDNKVLQQRLTLGESNQFKDILHWDEHHWKTVLPSNKEWTAKRKIVIEAVTELSAVEHEDLATWLLGTERGSQSMSQLSVLLRERHQNLEQMQKQILKLQNDIYSKGLEHYKLLNENCETLWKLISEYQSNHLTVNTANDVMYLTEKTRALELKLIVIKLQLMVATYSPDKVVALKHIRAHLDATQQQLESQLIETRQALDHYQTLGPNFVSLSQEYHQIKLEIENKQWALKELGKSQQQPS